MGTSYVCRKNELVSRGNKLLMSWERVSKS